MYMHVAMFILNIQWNSSKLDTIGAKDFVRCSEASLAQRLVVDHASYNRGHFWYSITIINWQLLGKNWRHTFALFQLLVTELVADTLVVDVANCPIMRGHLLLHSLKWDHK